MWSKNNGLKTYNFTINISAEYAAKHSERKHGGTSQLFDIKLKVGTPYNISLPDLLFRYLQTLRENFHGSLKKTIKLDIKGGWVIYLHWYIQEWSGALTLKIALYKYIFIKEKPRTAIKRNSFSTQRNSCKILPQEIV